MTSGRGRRKGRGTIDRRKLHLTFLCSKQRGPGRKGVYDEKGLQGGSLRGGNTPYGYAGQRRTLVSWEEAGPGRSISNNSSAVPLRGSVIPVREKRREVSRATRPRPMKRSVGKKVLEEKGKKTDHQ